MRNSNYADHAPITRDLSVRVNGKEMDVLRTGVAYFVSATCSDVSLVEIRLKNDAGSVEISPKRLAIEAAATDHSVVFRLERPELLHIRMDGLPLPLFFYGNSASDYDGKATYYFGAGQVYEAGEIELSDGESVYIEAGAVVRGSIRAYGANNIKVYGEGVLDGSCFRSVRDYRTILLYDCSDVVIRDIVMIEPPCWMIMLAACRHVRIERIKQIGEVVSSDGIDIVGSSHVRIENCMLRNNDDCVVVKAFDWDDDGSGRPLHAARNVKDVTVRGCIFVNGNAGNAIEIGHELTIDEVRDVRFEDIDIVSVHGYGAAFSIHVGDRATVRDIVFENIRVEHYYDKLIDFRVMRSMYNKDEERGHIQNVLLKDIDIAVSRYNPGYSVSVIGGYDAGHRVEDIVFENVRLGGKKVTNANQLDLFTKEADRIIFR